MTTQPPKLKEIAWKIINDALKAVDPAIAVKNYFRANPAIVEQIKATPGHVFVVGAGKAGAPMSAAVRELFPNKIAAGRVIVKYGHLGAGGVPLEPIQLIEAGHPVPDEAGLAGARAIAQLLSQTTADDTVICLFSGGGSALLTLPAEGLTLADLQATTQALLAAGATINQVNTIRKHLSAVKGGGIARLAAPAAVYALILSDVVGDPLEVIASGPTVPDPTTFADVWALVEQFGLQNALPSAVRRRLQAGHKGDLPDTPKSGNSIFKRVTNVVIGSNKIAAQAAVESAQAAGFNAQLLTTFIEGEAREVGRVVAGLAKGLAHDEGMFKRPACLVLGGETTVTLKGNGKGGRNQEMALSAAIALAGWENLLITCLGTDGSDGPTNAAGAFADGATVSRARALGLNPLDFLQRNDSYNFFAPLDGLIITGPTNTNVNDLTIILVN
jgi:hydroxypyruvate reductase